MFSYYSTEALIKLCVCFWKGEHELHFQSFQLCRN